MYHTVQVNGRSFIVDVNHVDPGDPATGTQNTIEYTEVYEPCGDDLSVQTHQQIQSALLSLYKKGFTRM